MAIYDSEFGDYNSPMHSMINEYTVPACFSSDIFSFCNTEMNDCNDKDYETERPPWRWILIGPERSGTGLHIDPLWTNAWVTVLQGRKRWMLFPPGTPKDKIGMMVEKREGADGCDDIL